MSEATTKPNILDEDIFVHSNTVVLAFRPSDKH